MLKIVLYKIDKILIKKKDWVMGDEQYYDGLKNRNVTAITI